MIGRRLIDVLGPAQPLTTFGAAAGVLEIPLADGSPAYGTVRSLHRRTASSRSCMDAPRRWRPGRPTPR